MALSGWQPAVLFHSNPKHADDYGLPSPWCIGADSHGLARAQSGEPGVTQIVAAAESVPSYQVGPPSDKPTQFL